MKLNIESLEVRRSKPDLILLYKILHRLVDIDFNNFFSFKPILGASLRTRRHQFYISRQQIAKTEVRNNFYTYRVTKYWNALPESIVSSPTLETFKLRLKTWQLRV